MKYLIPKGTLAEAYNSSVNIEDLGFVEIITTKDNYFDRCTFLTSKPGYCLFMLRGTDWSLWSLRVYRDYVKELK